jgi:hypothetical protein
MTFDYKYKGFIKKADVSMPKCVAEYFLLVSPILIFHATPLAEIGKSIY